MMSMIDMHAMYKALRTYAYCSSLLHVPFPFFSIRLQNCPTFLCQPLTLLFHSVVLFHVSSLMEVDPPPLPMWIIGSTVDHSLLVACVHSSHGFLLGPVVTAPSLFRTVSLSPTIIFLCLPATMSLSISILIRSLHCAL